MKRLISVLALSLAVGLAVSACSDDAAPGAPPSGNTTPDPTFRATLSTDNEVPPVTNAQAGATGVMNITINATRDSAGAIISAGVTFDGSFANFPAGTVITAAHIHPGVAGSNGSVIVSTGITAGEITLATGSGTLVKSGIAISIDLANQIIANPSAYYFNAHTAANPGGAIRGQLVRTN